MTEFYPEWAVVGLKLPSGMYRMYASQDLKAATFSLPDDGPSEWVLNTRMGRMLIVDKPTPAECMARIAECWAAADAAAKEDQERKQRAIR